MKRRLRLWTFVLLSAGLSACGEGLGPDLGEPAVYQMQASWDCTGWGGGSAPAQNPLGLFDLTYVGPADRKAILRTGGRIVHEFNVPTTIRAIVPVSSVPTLGANLAAGVADASQIKITVGVRYNRPITEADRDYLRALAGRVDAFPDPLYRLWAELPDSLVPAVRRQSGVAGVETSVLTCSEPMALLR